MQAPADPESERVAADLVRRARADQQLTQRILATAAGVPQSTIARIESGHMQPSLPLLYRVLAAAGVRARTILEPIDAVDPDVRPAYQPMTLIDLAGHFNKTDDEKLRWRLIAEFLEEYSHELVDKRAELLRAEPPTTGDERWDVFLAALAEHLAARDGRGVDPWAARRRLDVFWFPFNTPAARVDAFVHAPASFRRRGIFVAPQELGVA